MKIKILIVGVMLIAVFIGAYLALQSNQAVGSVMAMGEYKSASTRSYNGTALTNLSVLKSESGTLGSVIITGATAVGQINLYDATTSNATLRTNSATTTLITIPATTLAATYTYDISFYDGLLVELIGTVGTSTITFR